MSDERMTFDEFWVGFEIGHSGCRAFAAAAWEACEAALRAERDEAVALAVAGAHLAAAHLVEPSPETHSELIPSAATAKRLLSLTSADAQAALAEHCVAYAEKEMAPLLEVAERREKLLAEKDATIARWKKAVEGLTPSGSEFVNDPESCAAFIRHRTEYPRIVIEARAEIARLQSELAAAKLKGSFDVLAQIRDFRKTHPMDQGFARTFEFIGTLYYQYRAAIDAAEGGSRP